MGKSEGEGNAIFLADPPELIRKKVMRAVTDAGPTEMNQEKPDLIILDVMFGSQGESKGFDFAQKLKHNKLFASIPVLMVTAINTERPFFNFSPETDGEYLPVDAFIDKPVKTEELYIKVEELLKQKTSKWSNWPQKKE